MKAVIEEAKKYDVRVHRVSQGTGIYLMPKPELMDMMRLARDNRMELCLFVTPRNAWDLSATARTDAGRNSSGGHRGADQLLFALEDVYRACELGLRSILVNDIGLLSVVRKLQDAGKLPSDLQSKVSVQMGRKSCDGKTSRKFGYQYSESADRSHGASTKRHSRAVTLRSTCT